MMKASAVSAVFYAGIPPLARGARTFDRSNITLAAVVGAPAGWPLPVVNKDFDGHHFNLSATVEYATDLVSQARDAGADLVAFPELWFPGYPKSYEKKWQLPFVEEYVAQSLQVNSTEWRILLDAAKDNEIFLSFGYSERSGDFIYMSQALIGPDGDVLINRRKLRPSGSERGFWSDGSVDGLQVVNTALGRIGMLQCWEHMRPAMTFSMQAQRPHIHIGAWPYNVNPGTPVEQPFEEAEVALSSLRYMSITTGAVTVTPSIGYGFILDQTKTLAESDSNKTSSADGSHGSGPIIYASVNGSTWDDSLTYDVDGEWSWGILQQIEEGFPSYIPKVEGDFVPFRQYSTEIIIRNVAADNVTEDQPPSTSVATELGVPTSVSSSWPVPENSAQGLVGMRAIACMSTLLAIIVYAL